MTALTLNDVRKKFPQYDDMSDQQLADALHSKFYNDMPREDFDARIGLTPGNASTRSNDAYSQALDAASAKSQQVPTKQTGLLANIGAGIDEGANAILGAPVDIPVWAGNQLIDATNSGLQMAGAGRPLPNIPNDLPGSRQNWEKTQESLGFTPPSAVVPEDEGQRLARSAAEAGTMAVVPDVVIGKVGELAAKTPGAISAGADMLGQLFGQSKTAGQFARNIGTNAAAGAGATAAMDAAPDPLKPVAGLAGGLAAGTLAHGVTALPGVVKAGANVIGDFAAPLTQGGREKLAGQQLREAATSPGDVIDAINNAPAEIVPGSRPTTFQQTGDMGLGALERGVSTKNPEAFNVRRAEQNAARLGAIEDIQPTGSPETVSNALRHQLQQLDDITFQRVDNATQRARQAAEDLGQGITPDMAGQRLRASLEKARDTAKEREAMLWDAVDPDRSLGIAVSNTRKAVRNILDDLPASAKAPGGEEAGVYQAIGQYGDVVPVRELRALQSRLNEAMRDERSLHGDTASYARMSRMNSAIFDDLDQTVAARVADDNKAVAAGLMREEDTLAATYQAAVERWKAERDALASQRAGQSVGQGAGGAIPAGSGGVSPVFRAQGTSRGGFRDTPRDPRLSPPGLTNNWDEAALGRLNAAREATLDRVNRFDNRTLAPALQRPATNSPYNMADSQVAARAFRPGAKSYDDIKAMRAAIGDGRALSVLRNYAIDRLRTAALREDGTIDPGKLTGWRRAHADALRAFPDLDRQLSDVTKVSEAMETAAATRKVALEEAQKGVLGKLIGVDNPDDVTRVIGSLFGRQDSVKQMQTVREAIGDNKEALQGLRKAVADFIVDRFVGNTEAATSGLGTIKSDQFQTFVARNKAALRVAGFNDTELSLMDDIAEDLQRANRSLTSVKLPNGSNTAQDVFAAKVGDRPATLLTRIVLPALAGGAGALVGGPVAAVSATIATPLLSALRANGIAAVDDLVKDALLNPQKARMLMIRATPKTVQSNALLLSQVYRRAAMTSLAQIGQSPRPRLPGLGPS